MCIICNMPAPDGVVEAMDFLAKWDESNQSLKRASEAMLKVSEKAATPELRKHYRNFHKKMVRAMRDWNRLNEDREPAGMKE